MMIRVWMSKASAALLLTASALALTTASAQAADLGGDCCADLEERIAELEATTARKGNRKVSLEISGQVNEALMFWDDGTESDAYIVTNDNSRSRFRFKGKAKIDADTEAGYLLEIGVRGANSKRASQIDPDGNDTAADVGLDLRHSAWYLKNKKVGAVWVGKTSTAAEDITEANLSQTGSFAKFSDVEDSGLGMRLRSNGSAISGLSWRRLLKDTGDQAGEGDRQMIVRYDTPEFYGFTGVAAWGQDDYWDVGIKYAGEVGDFKLAARIAYGETTDDSPSVGSQCVSVGVAANDADEGCNHLGGSISVMHEPTGLYANFAAGRFEDEEILNNNARLRAANADEVSTFWAVEAGIERKWLPLGKTTVFGQYYKNEGGANDRRDLAANDPINPFGATSADLMSSEVEVFGLGVAQGLDAAAMTLYLSYRHIEGDLTVARTTGATTQQTIDLDDLDIVMTGAIIKF